MISRRAFLTKATAMGAAAMVPGLLEVNALAAGKPGRLALYGPPAGPSVTLSRIAAGGALAKHVERVDFKVYKGPDALRAGFLRGDWKIAVAPSYVVANLANRGLPVRLLNIMTEGLLSVMSFDGAISKPADLKGKTIGMFFKNDMPDLVFGMVMRAHGLREGKDYRLHYTAAPNEAVRLLLSGRIRHCVLPEPAATVGFVKARKMGKKLHRAIHLSAAWAGVTGGAPRIPQAGTMVHESLLKSSPAVIEAYHAQCVAATKWVKANPGAAAKTASKYLKIPPPILRASVPHCNLVAHRAGSMRAEIEGFYKLLAKRSPAIIGGKLPDGNFYL